MSFKINLVEDEQNLVHILTSYLEKEGWIVRPFTNGAEAREVIRDRPHLWILDIMLPGVDGYQLIREIKADSPAMPVIFISARDADIDRIVGLEMGSDDYLPKPFLPRELVIRARKLLERVYDHSESTASILPKLLTQIGPYVIDREARSVSHEGIPAEITSKEFDLLIYLLENQGYPLDREKILRHVWGIDYFGTDRVVDDLVRRLRKKLAALRVETIYGYGYRLVKP
ncbi:MAG: response regulator transcription factor [Bacillota bacterium]